MVDLLIVCVGVMVCGNVIFFLVCGWEVKFIFEVFWGDFVESVLCVWLGNECDQELFIEDVLDDFIFLFLLIGQQILVFGCWVFDVIEIVDGSCCCKVVILMESDYCVLVGELDDEQMVVLFWLGNDYWLMSVYECGLCYISWLQNEFVGNIFVFVDVENIFCKIIICCINMVKLFKFVVVLFVYSGELFVWLGEVFQKVFVDKEELLKQQVEIFYDQKKVGLIFEVEEVISFLIFVLK